MIRVDKVSQWYGSVVALSDVTLEIGGGVTGLLGPNGAGKTSLIRLLTGQMRVRSGSVTVDGQAPWHNPELLARIGYAPEGEVFHWRLSGRQFVEALLGLSGYTGSERSDRAQSALERVELTPAADRSVAGYSKGMKQRIKIAQAIAHDPELLILDEPFEGTDPVARRRLMDLVRQLGEEGTLVLLSSHVLHEVESLTDRVILLAAGKVLATGTIDEIRGLLDKYPLQIEVGGPSLRQVALQLIRLEHVMAITLDDTVLRVRTRDPDDCYRRLGELGAEGLIARLACPDQSLEAVFEYLTGARK